jgi:hypothetical protein
MFFGFCESRLCAYRHGGVPNGSSTELPYQACPDNCAIWRRDAAGLPDPSRRRQSDAHHGAAVHCRQSPWGQLACRPSSGGQSRPRWLHHCLYGPCGSRDQPESLFETSLRPRQGLRPCGDGIRHGVLCARGWKFPAQIATGPYSGREVQTREDALRLHRERQCHSFEHRRRLCVAT